MLGAILLQDLGEGHKAMTFASRLLNDKERNLSTYEKEALTCIWTVKKFSTYLEHQEFDLMTDNQVIHVKGKDNTVSDCLSRMYNEKENEIIEQETCQGMEDQVGSGEHYCAIVKSIPEAFIDMAN
ncbi:hypothetical protein PR048_013323 [Dryococelus australis]|uniref:Reverse transcriptase RNase H-like domain-containing protein n=1 Tax=Dryococelus australis TaxID=614101 RepID=A0ABQ9HTD2_9NEOP|nr:hypothetical protein PR048_013323 [Dryococelus australis]